MTAWEYLTKNETPNAEDSWCSYSSSAQTSGKEQWENKKGKDRKQGF